MDGKAHIMQKSYNKNTKKTNPKTNKGRTGTIKGSSNNYKGKSVASKKKIETEKHLPPDPAEIRNILGVTSDFTIAKLTPIGAYLTPFNYESNPVSVGNKLVEPSLDLDILLPKNEMIGREFKKNDIVQAFVYLDSEDRPIATLNAPVLSIGKLAVLNVKEVNEMGAFLDWGLAKDLFLPFKEQTIRAKKDEQVLVTLYIDKSSRLCASMKIYKLLQTDSPYKANDHVKGFVYELSDEYGAYVAVDSIYSALVPVREMVKPLRVGEMVTLRVSKVLPDGKLELAMREQGHLQLDDDCKRIYEELQASKKGFLPYHDKSESLVIKNKFNMSKIAFKRAIGHLYKQGMISIKEDGIYLN